MPVEDIEDLLRIFACFDEERSILRDDESRDANEIFMCERDVNSVEEFESDISLQVGIC